jgi:transposase
MRRQKHGHVVSSGGKTRQTRGGKPVKAGAANGNRYSHEFQRDCLKLLAGGMTKVAVRKRLGVSALTLSRWQAKHGLPDLDVPRAAAATARQQQEGGRAEGGGGPGKLAERRSRAPHDNVAGLSQQEIDEILALKKAHFTMGPAQIRAQLKRFRGWRLSVRAIARALKAHGYQVEHRSARNEQGLMPCG